MKKVKFSDKDAWDLKASLGPIIHDAVKAHKTYMKKFYKRTGCLGIPNALNDPDIDSKILIQKWFDILDKIIFAFGDNAPNIAKYKFKMKHNPVHGGFDPTNPEEHERYRKDQDIWCDKRDEGYKLFAEFFRDMWV